MIDGIPNWPLYCPGALGSAGRALGFFQKMVDEIGVAYDYIFVGGEIVYLPY